MKNHRASLLLAVVVGAALIAVSFPWWLRAWQGREIRQRVDRLLVRRPAAGSPMCSVDPVDLVRALRPGPVLASWQEVGGCGVGGGGGAGGAGVKWIGRNVTGGILNAECLGSATFLDEGQAYITNVRGSTELGDKWLFGVNAPFLYKVQQVNVFGEDKTARIAGWGDLGFDLTYKLGIANASRATVQLAAPTGAHDAVRQGVYLPQRLQLGAGRWSGGMSLEHTMDRLWGMILFGGNVQYGGGENTMGDLRGSTASLYSFLGYLWGPFVPHVGVTVVGRSERDRERREVMATQSLATGSLQTGLEWGNDWFAIIVVGNGTWSARGNLESWTSTLGIATSLF